MCVCIVCAHAYACVRACVCVCVCVCACVCMCMCVSDTYIYLVVDCPSWLQVSLQYGDHKAAILCACLVRLIEIGEKTTKITDARYGFSFIPANIETYEYVNTGK